MSVGSILNKIVHSRVNTERETATFTRSPTRKVGFIFTGFDGVVVHYYQ